MIKNILFFVLVFFVLKTNAGKNVDEKFLEYAEEFYTSYLSFHPLLATYFGVSDFNNLFANENADDYLSDYIRFLIKTQNEIKLFRRDSCSLSLQTSYDLLEYVIESELKKNQFPNNLLPLKMFTNIIQFAKMSSGESTQPFNTHKDYDNSISRMYKFSSWIDTIKIKLKEGLKQRILLPGRITEKTIEIIRNILAKRTTKSEFYRPILLFPPNFSYAHKIFYENAFVEIIEEKLFPALQELESFLTNEYLPSSRNINGLSTLPNSNDWYKNFIIEYSGMEIEPDSVFQLGKSEVQRFRLQIDSLLDKYNFNGNYVQFWHYLMSRTSIVYSTESLLEQYQEIKENVEDIFEDFFFTLPKENFELEAINESYPEDLCSHYEAAPVDKSCQAKFMFEARYIKKFGDAPNKSLFLHEAIPGHHYQSTYINGRKDLPDFHKHYFISAFVEGWALYSENLGNEFDIYESDLDKYNYFHSELVRSVRMVVDTGLHSRGWTFSQAFDYYLQNTGLNLGIIIKEIDRMLITPGQALSYKLGALKILELRGFAKLKIGEDFDCREFHKKILKDGALPLALLEKIITSWINSQ